MMDILQMMKSKNNVLYIYFLPASYSLLHIFFYLHNSFFFFYCLIVLLKLIIKHVLAEENLYSNAINEGRVTQTLYLFTKVLFNHLNFAMEQKNYATESFGIVLFRWSPPLKACNNYRK